MRVGLILTAVLGLAALGWLWQSRALRAAAGPTAVSAGKAGIEWVTVPGGSFRMGSDGAVVDSRPRHRVAIGTFQIARTEATNRQYAACVAEGACTPPADCGDAFRDDEQPVVGVDWEQARAFADWAGGRLPSEAEWEYAARSAGRSDDYPWGAESATCERAVVLGCSKDAPLPVCSKPMGKTAQGLCDMAGNAWEWVQDWHHGSYAGAPADGGAWGVPPGAFRVARGGSWQSDASHARVWRRSSRAPAYRNCHLGLRPARDAAAAP